MTLFNQALTLMTTIRNATINDEMPVIELEEIVAGDDTIGYRVEVTAIELIFVVDGDTEMDGTGIGSFCHMGQEDEGTFGIENVITVREILDAAAAAA